MIGNENNYYGIIYEAINKINGKRYIGQTITTLVGRKRQHISDSKHDNTCFHKAIRKYGQDNFEWNIIDTSETIEELDYKEVFWIKFFNTYNSLYGYNMTFGGQRTKECLKNKNELYNTPNYCDNRPFRNIVVYDVKGNYLYTTKNQTKLANRLGVSGVLIGYVLQGIKPSVNNHYIFYEDEFTEEKLEICMKKKRFKPFALFDIKQNKCIGIWNNILKCEKEQSLATRRGIQLQLNTIQKQHPRKFIVKYLDDIVELKLLCMILDLESAKNNNIT